MFANHAMFKTVLDVLIRNLTIANNVLMGITLLEQPQKHVFNA